MFKPTVGALNRDVESEDTVLVTVSVPMKRLLLAMDSAPSTVSGIQE
jgi:hypothetical protein